MKLRDGFIMQEIGDEVIVVPTGEASKCFRGVVRINDTTAFLMEHLKKDITENELVDILLKEYRVDRDTAAHDVKSIISQLNEIDALENL